MRIFLDSASVSEVEECIDVIDGITTNPSLIAKEPKGRFENLIREIVRVVESHGKTIPISVEVFAEEPGEMVDQACEIVRKVPYSNLIVKVPVGWRELNVIQTLGKYSIKTNCTCCFTAGQLLMGTRAGAHYVSLFYNRAKDLGLDPIAEIKQFNESVWGKVELICGSIRSPKDIMDCFAAGANIVTAGLKHIKGLCEHQGTNDSVAGFLKDFKEWMI